MQVEVPDDGNFYDNESEMSVSPSKSAEPHPPRSPSPLVISPPASHLPVPENNNGNQNNGVSSQERLDHVNDRGNEMSDGEGGAIGDSLGDDMGDDVPLSQNSSPHSSPRRSNSPSPSRERSNWNLSLIEIPDSLTDASRHQLCMDRFFHPNGLMQPRDQDLSSLDANGKTWVMERPPLSQPIDGNTWSFVDECHAGITSELLKVIYFFDIINGMSNHFNWNGFVVGTDDLSGGARPTFLEPSFAPNNKDINGVMMNQFVDSDESISFKGVSSGVDTAKLLYASELNSSGTVYTPLELFRISISFTAAVFESSRVKHLNRRTARGQDDSDDEDEQQQAIFGVVSVTSLRNVDSLRLMLVFFK